jgi:hypothetical protein
MRQSHRSQVPPRVEGAYRPRMIRSFVTALACSALAVGCNSSSSAPIVYGDASAGSAETPPITNGPDVEAWLRAGDYKSWHCEPMPPHAPRGPSPHGGFNRVCSNDVVNPIATEADAGAWPQGVASVKELYNSASDSTPEGYAVTVKTEPSSASGANWFFYERLTDGTIETPGGLNASVCVGCHGEAGQDSAHTTSTGSRDFIYTPVP